MAKRINRNRVNLIGRHKKVTPKASNPKSKLNKGSAKTSTPSSVKHNKRTEAAKVASDNLNKTVDKAIEKLKTPKQVTTNNPTKGPSKTVYRNAAQNGYLDKLKPEVKAYPINNSYLNNVPSVLGGTVGFNMAAQAEANYQLQTGKITEEHSNKVNAFYNMLSKHMSFDEYKTWDEENRAANKIITPAQKPTNMNKEEEKLWSYFVHFENAFDAGIAKIEKEKQEEEERKYYTADYMDYDINTNNSFFDIARNWTRRYFEGDAYTANREFWRESKEYINRYILNPIRHGDFGILANNVLVNLGETMDMLATAPKAILTESGKSVYGTGQKFMAGQDVWVYSGGKETQKQLIELGAMDLITYGDERMRRGKETHNPDLIKMRLKEAGLWNEYLKFKSEHESADLGGEPIKEIGKAYTTHENYYVDTGMLGFDLLLETVLDPSFMIGGFSKSFTSAGTKAMTRKGVRAGLEEAFKSPEDLARLSEVLEQSEAVGKKYYKLMDEGYFDAKSSSAAIDKNVKGLASILEAKGLITKEHREAFINHTTSVIKQDMDTRHFKLIQGVRALDKSLDRIDSTALKTVFAAPYLGYKGIKIGQTAANRFALKRAVGRVQNGLVDEKGYLSIANLEETLTRASNEYIINSRMKNELYNEIFTALEKNQIKDSADLIKLKDRMLKTDDIKLIDMSVGIYITRITKGRFADVESFMKHLEGMKAEQFMKNNRAVRVCNNYLLELKEILSHRNNLIQNQVRDYYRKLKDVTDEVSFTELYSDAIQKKDVLPDDFFQKLDTINKNYDPEVIKQVVRDYETKYNTTLKDASPVVADFKDIKTPYSEADLLMKGEMTEKAKRAFNNLPGVRFKTKEIPGAYKGMKAFLNNVRKNSNNVDLRDFIDLHQAFHAAYIFRDAQGLVTSSERRFKNELDKLATGITREDLSTTVGKDVQLVQMQLDKLAVMDKFLAETNLKNDIFELMSPETPIGGFISQISKKVSEWENLDTMTNIPDFSRKCSELLQEVEVAKAVIELRDRLAPLPDRERWAVLECLFGISKGAPEDYVKMSSFERGKFIEQVNLWLNSNYGISTVSLDGFSKQAQNFESDFYKSYEEELQDVKLQERIKKFLEGGHLDPVKDVQKQMLQIILKDPDSVKAYNSMSKRKDVFFTDIETQGLNTGLHEITSIATKKWVEIPEGASLNEILDIIEDSSTEVLHKATYTREYLEEHISDTLLESTFRNNKTLKPTREARLEKYIEMYGVKEGEKAVSEKDILTDFMVRLDQSYTEYSKEVPTLVVHNNNGFDLNFIQARCTNYKTYPHQIPHMNHIQEASENTIMRLKGLEDDVILSHDSMHLIIESVENFMGKIKNKGSMRLFSEAKINDGLKMLDFEVGKVCDNWSKDELLDSIKEAHNKGLLTKVREGFTETSRPIKEAMAIYRNNIVANPNYNIYASENINNLMRELKDMNDTPYAPLAYKVLFSDSDASRYFTYDAAEPFSEVELKGMQQFTERVNQTVNRRLKANPHIGKHFEDYKNLINYLRTYAQELDAWDEYSFLKYINEPTSVNEAYVMAQQLWDVFYTPLTREDIIKIDTEEFNKLRMEKDLNIKYQNLFGDHFDMESVISPETSALLKDYKGLYHQDIYKDATKLYMTMYMTDIFNDNLAYQKIMDDFQNGKATFEEVATWNEVSEYASVLDKVYLQSHNTYASFIDAFKTYLDNNPEELTPYLKRFEEEMSDRRELMSRNILGKVTESEENLLSHLIYHNQLLNIPLEGSLQYEAAVQTLLKKLRTEYTSDKLVFTVNEGFLHIGLSKESVLEITGDKKFKFKNEDKVYEPIKYDRIKVDVQRIFLRNPELAALYDALDDQVYRMTEGTSAGSVGTLHTYSKQMEMYELLPSEFVSRCMTRSHTCDSKLWHGASFDMSNLGDSAHCWKYGKANDIDPLVAMKETVEEFANRVKSERFLLDTLFNKDSDLTIRNMFGPHLSSEEKLGIIESMRDYSCVILKPAKTSSGYAVHEVSVKSAKALELAEESHAIFIAHDDFILLQEMFNNEEITGIVLKAVTKYFAYLKNSMLMFTGTWIRNWVDATIKTAGDTGSIADTVRYQFVAASLMKDYKKVVHHFEKTRGLTHMSMATIKREFDSVPDIQISYEQFEFLEGWFKNSISGGQSSLVKAMVKNSKGNRNTALKQGMTTTFKERRNVVQQADTVASEIERFQDLPYEEIESLCDSLTGLDYRYHGISRERFLEGFRNLDVLSDSEYLSWNRLANEIIQIRSKRLTHRSLRSVGTQTIDNFFSAVMTPMSRVEEIARLGEYLFLDAQGYKRGEIFKKITDTHFNYDIKTNRMKLMECIIPMLTYEKCNALYWVKQINDNPRMLKYLEHFWGELSWNNDCMSPEEREGNEYFMSMLRSGAIPLGDSGLYLKANPSFLAALDLVTGGPDVYISKLSTPLQLLSKLNIFTLGEDARALLEGDIPFEEFGEELIKGIPIIGTVYDKFDKGLTAFDNEATYQFLKENAQHGWQGVLVRMLPSVFGASYRWEKYTKLKQLEGETFEGYCRRVKVERGLVWDNNQRLFVKPEEVIPGMLNDPNLSWEETNYYNFILFGTCYDSNQGVWVNKDDPYISGGLNSNDLSWDELAALQYAIHGKVWDYDAHAFVKVAEPQVVYSFPERDTKEDTGLVRGDHESILSKLGLVSPVFADTLTNSALIKSNNALKDKTGKYILTGDAEHDNKVFELIKAEVRVPNTGNNSYMRYQNGNAGGYRYKKNSYLPSRIYKNNGVYHRRAYHKKTYANKTYADKTYVTRSYANKVYANKTYPGLRININQRTSYDVYYDYEYSFNYKYRSVIKNVADYPQTRLGIDRYLRLRGGSLIRDFRSRTNKDVSNTKSVRGLSVKQRLDRLKMHWWMR